MAEQYESFINGIERECEEMSKSILEQLCKRAIKKMNKLDSYLAGSTDDYPKNFTFFDILSIELETRTYNEINPHLQDYVEDTLLQEYDDLPRMERFILDHSESWALIDSDDDAIKKKIFESFNYIRIQHLSLKKIENYQLKL
jgi:hypothetical protein